MGGTLSRELSQRLDEAAPTGFVEIILELRSEVPEPDPSLPRSERIAARKASAQRLYDPVEEAIARAGGEILERAWINQTLRARLPVHRVHDLATLDEVALIDVPRPLEPGSESS